MLYLFLHLYFSCRINKQLRYSGIALVIIAMMLFALENI